jgi:hypothetical protein
MPDSPDYSKFLGTSLRFSLQDFGELAARLGSVMSYDRRGEVIWFDTFSYGISGWTIGTSGAGAGVSLDAGNGLHGGYSAKLLSGTGVSRLASIQKIFSIFERGRCAIEFCFEPSSGVEHVLILFNYSSGGRQRSAGVKIRYDNNTVEYQSGNNIYTSIVTDFDDEQAYTKIVFCKLVLDTENNEYVRALINHHHIDLQGEEVPDVGAFSFTYFSCVIRVVGTSGSNDPLLVKQAIFTSNEP